MFNSLTEIGRNAGDSSKEGKIDLVIICLTFRKVRKLPDLEDWVIPAPWPVACVLLQTIRLPSSVGAAGAGWVSVPGLPASPMLGLQLIDPLLLKHPAIDPPRKERKKWKKSISTKQLNKTLHSTGLMAYREGSWCGLSGKWLWGQAQPDKKADVPGTGSQYGRRDHTYTCTHTHTQTHKHMAARSDALVWEQRGQCRYMFIVSWGKANHSLKQKD